MDTSIKSEVRLVFELASVFGLFVGMYVGSTLVKWVTRAGSAFPHVPFNLFCLFAAVVCFVVVRRQLKRLTTLE